MKNLGVLLRLARSITPELDTKAVGDEIRERIVEELDYELEASNQRTMARIYEGHPFIAIPAVVTSLCRERVIVTEFVSGDGFEEMRSAPDAERDRIGEILFRFYFGSMYRYRRFSGDPHPGQHARASPTAGSPSSTSACSRRSTATSPSSSSPVSGRRSTATPRSCIG